MLQNWGWIVVAAIAVIGTIYKIIKWTAVVESDRHQFREFMNEVREDIKKILQRIPGGEPVEKVTSPIALTDYGKDLSQSINASEIADIYIIRVTKDVEKFNAYEIQEYCFSFSKNDLLNDLKTNHSARHDKIHEVAFEQGIDVEKITRVIALELRDKILSTLNKRHSEIDHHSPNKP